MRREASHGHPDAYLPAKALACMREAVASGRYQVHPRVLDRLLELGLAYVELRSALEACFEEIDLRHHKPPDHAFDPPGHGFVWDSKRFQCRMYLKFRLEGKRRPVCWLYSLHPAAIAG